METQFIILSFTLSLLVGVPIVVYLLDWGYTEEEFEPEEDRLSLKKFIQRKFFHWEFV